ncbi:MAG: hypothetical protein KFF50_10895 [Desulfatitalea sp.]|nr:hypothetical protein [Desulfatitalea sp.]
MKAIQLDKQIKRHVIARRHGMHAVTAPGAEAVCARELAALSETVRVEALSTGGVDFSGRLEDLYRANLYLRTAGRVLLRVMAFKATNFRQLESQCAAVPWERYLPGGVVPACKVTAHRSRLYHSGAIAGRVTSVIGRYWADRQVPAMEAAGQTLLVRLEDDRAVFSLDSSGDNLYRRGLKTHSALAPLRETLAAAILSMAGYDPARPLLDPMCGAGTFSLEAALMAKGIAPGSRRGFAFMQWPAFRPRQWQHLVKKGAETHRLLERPTIHASDLDAEACRKLGACVQNNDLADAVTVACRDFFALEGTLNGRVAQPGLIVLNPPYGRRLSPGETSRAFYSRMGAKLGRDFRGWDLAVVVPDAALVATLPFTLNTFPLSHGGLPLQLLVGRIG